MTTQSTAPLPEARQTKLVRTDSLVTSKSNRKHKEEAVRKLAASMEEYGLMNPITIIQRGGKSLVVSGAGRLAGARLLEWKHIEALLLDEETSDKEVLLRRLHENNARSNPTFDELLDQVNQVMRAFGVDRREACKLAITDKGSASKINATCEQLSEEGMEYARKHGISLSVCYETARGSDDGQTQLHWLREHAAGRLSRQQISDNAKRLKAPQRKRAAKIIRLDIEINGVAFKVAMPESTGYENLGQAIASLKAKIKQHDSRTPFDLLPRMLPQGGGA